MFKLSIGDVVDVPVKFSANDAGKTSVFMFTLQARRLMQEELTNLMDGGSDMLVADFLAKEVHGWRGQRLVLGDDGKPAEFSTEALACMLTLTGLPALIFAAYLKTCGAAAKN